MLTCINLGYLKIINETLFQIVFVLNCWIHGLVLFSIDCFISMELHHRFTYIGFCFVVDNGCEFLYTDFEMFLKRFSV